MNLIKLILLASPLIVASLLFSPESAQASIITPTLKTAQVNLVSYQPTHELAATTLSQQSDPIRDYLSCGCSQCVKATLELQGKLPIRN